jgi:hypothetical protein
MNVRARETGHALMMHVPHVVAGQLETECVTEYVSRDTSVGFVTPRLDLNRLAPLRSTPGPSFDLPFSEIYDFLEQTGQRLNLGKNAHLQEALEKSAAVSTLPRDTLVYIYERIGPYFSREGCRFQVEQEIGEACLDGWQTVAGPDGSTHFRRAFPPRLIHLLAGNSPDVAAVSIARGALTKGVHLLKMASNDLYTATAILRTMAEVDASHPVLRSFSAVYWRGGDERIESALFRAQYFDKLVAWGGGESVRHAYQYLAPGFELITFDPKTSISIVGHEAFASEQTIGHVAELAASDVAMFEQDACASSRFQFVEGSVAEVDRYCAVLVQRLGVARPLNSAKGPPLSRELRDQIESLQSLGDPYRVWGKTDGSGIVIRSDEPVDFHPNFRTVNVIPVQRMIEAAQFVTVSTQTIGVYPSSRQTELRDAVAAMGGQRILPLGSAGTGVIGLPHDGMYPLQRFVKWISDSRGI